MLENTSCEAASTGLNQDRHLSMVFGQGTSPGPLAAPTDVVDQYVATCVGDLSGGSSALTGAKTPANPGAGSTPPTPGWAP